MYIMVIFRIIVGLIIIFVGQETVLSVPRQQNLLNFRTNLSEASLFDFVRPHHKTVTSNRHKSLHVARRNSPSENCLSDLFTLLQNMGKLDALSVLDAEAKIPAGVLRGNFLWMGNYKECLRQHSFPGANDTFPTHYCIATWKIELPKHNFHPSLNKEIAYISYLPLKTGLCLPSSCNETVVETEYKSALLHFAEMPFLQEIGAVLNLTDFICRSPLEQLDVAAICYLCLLSVICLAALLGSTSSIVLYINIAVKRQRSLKHQKFFNAAGEGVIIEDPSGFVEDKLVLCQHQGTRDCNNSQSIWEKLKCFSVFANGAKILTSTASRDHLLCIHGIRVLSMLWIILGHTYIHCLPVVDNLADVPEDIDSFAFQPVLHGTYAVDTFFLLSGFLLAFLYLKEANKLGRIFLPYIFIHRYWRLTPVYAIVIGYIASIFKYTGSGSFWESVPDYESCRTNWWWNLLYINNFQSIDVMCADYTWYLANDMQFYVLCSVLLFLLGKWPKWILSAIAMLLISSWAGTWFISNSYEIEPNFYNITAVKNFIEYEKKAYDSWDLIYSKPWCRIGPYLIGVLLAFLVCKTENKRNFLPVFQQMIGWVVAMFLVLVVVFGLYEFKIHSQIVFNFYNSLSRSSFSLGVAWILYNCLTGHAGLVNKILSWGAWLPLSRLTYSVYLIHPVVINWYFHSLNAPFHFTHLEVVTRYIAFVIMSYAIAFLVSVLVESPLMAVERVFFQPRLRKI